MLEVWRGLGVHSSFFDVLSCTKTYWSTLGGGKDLNLYKLKKTVKLDLHGLNTEIGMWICISNWRETGVDEEQGPKDIKRYS